MSVSLNTQAVLLLTAHFTKASGSTLKPLSPMEWSRFALWLKEHSKSPQRLMTGKVGDCLQGWSDKTISVARIEALLDRGPALALALEKWLRAGLWVMTRSDADYPKRLKKHLGSASPALFFGCGNRGLLDRGGLAVVGSRHACAEDLTFSQAIGAMAAGNGTSIVSGGAKGVDEAAMLGALGVEGTAIGVLSDSLLRAATSSKYRDHLIANNLVLVSSTYPDAGFNAGNAMQRNKYIYCLADAAVVVHSGRKGGTWTGAQENLKKNWVPLWVKKTEDTGAGNVAIVAAGGAWLADNIESIDMASILSRTIDSKPSTADLFHQALFRQADDSGDADATVQSLAAETTAQADEAGLDLGPEDKREEMPTAPEERLLFENSVSGNRISGNRVSENMDIYDFFLVKLKQVAGDQPITADEIVSTLLISKPQVNAWLNRALGEKKIEKFLKPARYQLIEDRQDSFDFLGD